MATFDPAEAIRAMLLANTTVAAAVTTTAGTPSYPGVSCYVIPEPVAMNWVNDAAITPHILIGINDGNGTNSGGDAPLADVVAELGFYAATPALSLALSETVRAAIEDVRVTTAGGFVFIICAALGRAVVSEDDHGTPIAYGKYNFVIGKN